jgi:thymidylate synthase (FAD)
MPQAKLRVRLERYTADPDGLAALAARACYAGEDLAELRDRDGSSVLRGVMESGHLSVVEHAAFTFAVEGVSRALLAQFTRHRIASFSVQSQRYVSLREGFEYVVPPNIEALGPEAAARYAAQMKQMHAWYAEWRRALGGEGQRANEDARFVLPNACATRLLVTMNARELLHFFSLRCCMRAQWEIREMAWAMLREASRVAPALFAAAGPGCLRGTCPEGVRACGREALVRQRFQSMTENDGPEA